MHDERIDKLADLLVNYSIGVQPRQKVMIRAGANASPLVREVYKKVLEAGAHPFVNAYLSGLQEIFYRIASDDQLSFVHEPLKLMIETYDVDIAIMSDENTRELNNIDPARIALNRKAMTPLFNTHMERSAKGELKWVVTLFPTEAYAQDAEMSLTEYEDFVFNACMPDLNDPVGYWRKVSAKQQHVVDWLKGKKEVHVTAPGTDLTLSIVGRDFVNCDCHVNVPDGEVFTGPVENSVNGHITFSYPTIYGGRMVSGVQLWFENGKCVKATADKNEDYLNKMLDTDAGARYLGEFAIGTNEGIQRFTGEILFDEKIGGSFHVALGAGYPETGNTNQSGIHWDMVNDLRNGGEIRVDEELLYQNGKFVI